MCTHALHLDVDWHLWNADVDGCSGINCGTGAVCADVAAPAHQPRHVLRFCVRSIAYAWWRSWGRPYGGRAGRLGEMERKEVTSEGAGRTLKSEIDILRAPALLRAHEP